MLMLVGSVILQLLPTSGYGTWRHLILPALTLASYPMAAIARLVRSGMLEVLDADYVRTARAKGLPERGVVLKHTLRNAAMPIVTVIGLQFGLLLGGAIVVRDDLLVARRGPADDLRDLQPRLPPRRSRRLRDGDGVRPRAISWSTCATRGSIPRVKLRA